jgi:hypothetical protein
MCASYSALWGTWRASGAIVAESITRFSFSLLGFL